MATFILVSGAWHGAWCWKYVSPLLRDAGHRVLAPDLPGMGADRTPFDRTSFEAWGRSIAELASAQSEPVVLVGHSRGGIVISQAAEYAPQAMQTTVYLAAMLLPNGTGMFDMVSRVPNDSAIAKAIVMTPDGLATTVGRHVVPTHFYNTTPPERVQEAEALLTPEPLFCGTAKMKLSEERFGRVRRAYIECLRDRSVAIELQRIMHSELPCWHVGTLDTDHSPFFSAPQQLAQELVTIAAKS